MNQIRTYGGGVSCLVWGGDQLGEAEAECQELERREKNALDLLEQVCYCACT